MTHLYNIDKTPPILRKAVSRRPEAQMETNVISSTYFGCKIFTIPIQISNTSLWINSIFISDMMDTWITPEHSISPYILPSHLSRMYILGRHLPLATSRKRRHQIRKKKKGKVWSWTDGRTG